MENDLISRSALLEAIEKHDECNPFLVDVDEVTSLIYNAPAVDAAQVVHSRFVNMGGFQACERCGASPGVHEPKPDNPRGFPPYCYACGARMDKEES